MYNRLRILALVLLCLVLNLACSRHGAASPVSSKQPSGQPNNDPYVGKWVNLKDSSERLSIQPESGAYIIENEINSMQIGESVKRSKYVGTKTNGVLRMSGAMGATEILYIKSSDLLVAAGNEYKRFDPRVDFPIRAMADIRSMATAIEAYATNDRSPHSNGCAAYPPGKYKDLGTYTSQYIAGGGIVGGIIPRDPWGNSYYYRSDQCRNYVLVSAGNDGRFPADLETDAIYQSTSDADADDIVYANGQFLRLPPGWTPRGRAVP